MSIEEIGQSFADFASNPWSTLVIPFLFYICGAFGKKLIREQRSRTFFVLGDIYLAPEAALANVAVAMTDLWTMFAQFDPTNHRGAIRATILLGATAFFVYLVVLAIHKQYDHDDHHHLKRFIYLGILCNFLALGMMFALIVSSRGAAHV